MKYFKHYVALLCSSYLLACYPQDLHPFAMFFLNLHKWLTKLFLSVSASYPFGTASANLLAVLIIPVLIAALPALIFYLTRKRFFPYFFQVIWVIWLIQATTIVVTYQTPLTYHPPLHW